MKLRNTSAGDAHEIAFVDVDTRSDLPRPPRGMRYLDFLGGTKELRCFLVPYDYPRLQFLNFSEELLDPSLLPIFEDNGIVLRQDASYAVPGFYVIGFRKQYRSLDEMPQRKFLKAFAILHRARTIMREVLNIEHIHVYYEEKPAKSCSAHFWLLPIYEEAGRDVPIIYDINLRSYLETFRFSERRGDILSANAIMREHMRDFRPASGCE